MRDALLVLGMHRGGTSAVAGALTKLGGKAPNTLMPADAFNTRGYFKCVTLYHFHDELLASAGSASGRLARLQSRLAGLSCGGAV